MEKTYGEILDIKGALLDLMNIKFPISTAISIAKVAKMIDDSIVVLEETKRILFTNYKVKRTQESGMLMLKAGDDNETPLFIKEFTELMAKKVELPGIDKIILPLSVSFTCENCNHIMNKSLDIEPSILYNLVDIVEAGEI